MFSDKTQLALKPMYNFTYWIYLPSKYANAFLKPVAASRFH